MSEGLCVGRCRPDARHEKSPMGTVFSRTYHARDTRDARSPMPTHGAQRELLWLTSPKSPNVQTAVWGLTPIGHTR